MMSNIGTPEILLILLIASVVLGPKNTQIFIHATGRAVRTFKKYITELKKEVLISEEVSDLKKELKTVIDELPDGDCLNQVKDVIEKAKRDIQEEMSVAKN